LLDADEEPSAPKNLTTAYVNKKKPTTPANNKASLVLASPPEKIFLKSGSFRAIKNPRF